MAMRAQGETPVAFAAAENALRERNKRRRNEKKKKKKKKKKKWGKILMMLHTTAVLHLVRPQRADLVAFV